jgi:hypothetical protein
MVLEEKALVYFIFSKIRGGSQFCNNKRKISDPYFLQVKSKMMIYVIHLNIF